MDWTHILVALVSGMLGAAAHKFGAHYSKRAYWADVNALLTVSDRDRRQTCPRSWPKAGYIMYYDRLPTEFNPLIDSDG